MKDKSPKGGRGRGQAVIQDMKAEPSCDPGPRGGAKRAQEGVIE